MIDSDGGGKQGAWQREGGGVRISPGYKVRHSEDS